MLDHQPGDNTEPPDIADPMRFLRKIHLTKLSPQTG
jgi:hypothetical protein